MTHYVVTKKLTAEGRKNFHKVVEWQKEMDGWLKAHGVKFESARHYLTMVGEESYETWLGYPNAAALDADGEKAKEIKSDAEYQKLAARGSIYLERIGSRILKEIV